MQQLGNGRYSSTLSTISPRTEYPEAEIRYQNIQKRLFFSHWRYLCISDKSNHCDKQRKNGSVQRLCFKLSPEALLEDSWGVTTSHPLDTQGRCQNSLRGLLPQGLRPQAPASPATPSPWQLLCVLGAGRLRHGRRHKPDRHVQVSCVDSTDKR